MELPSRKKCEQLGFIAAAVFYLGWFFAVVADGTWVFGTDTLSDLGISDNFLSVILFNCVCCFVCALIWMTEVSTIARTESGAGRVYGIIAVCSMVALIGVGIFNKDYGTPHYVCAFSYLGLVLASMVAACLSDFFGRKRPYVIITIVLLILSPILYFTLTFPVFEGIASIVSVLWSLLVAEAYGSYGY